MNSDVIGDFIFLNLNNCIVDSLYIYIYIYIYIYVSLYIYIYIMHVINKKN